MGAEKLKPDFSGYATKAGIKCSDGRTIMPGAFKHQDTTTVPLVWQHGHSESTNVLGHAILENREDGVYAHGYFNETSQGTNGRMLVQHGDIVSLSIYANKLVENGKNVMHGFIREVSLVLSGANPGALIDNVELSHGEGEGYITLDDEAVIYSGATLEHGDVSVEEETTDETAEDNEQLEHDEGGSDRTVQEVYDGMDEEEKSVLHYFVGAALENPAVHSDDDQNVLEHIEGDNQGKEVGRMSRNVFEQQNDGKPVATHSLTHSDVTGILADFKSTGSMRGALENYALAHGINSIETLFPDAKNVTTTPEWDKRRTEWVSTVLNGTKKSPFSRIKSIVADITHDEARARGYIKGNLKKEEFFGLTKRSTSPATVYKKQKLDRDDIIDIVDFDVVLWLWGEMRLMLDEELARAILIGDGREIDDDDKIKDPAGSNEGAGIRSILNEHDLYAATVNVNIDDANSDYSEIIDAVTRAQTLYKGSGSPTFFTTQTILTEMLLLRDEIGRRLYRTSSDVAAELGVSSIVVVEVFDTVEDLVGIIVNLSDYTVGTDKGGDIAKFEDFDIDYNQYKYLIETRLSGALTKIRSAMVIKKVVGTAVLAKPQKPGWDEATGTITPKTTTGVTYRRSDTDAVVTTAVPIVLAAGQELKIYAEPTSGGYYFADNVTDEWTFEKPAA